MKQKKKLIWKGKKRLKRKYTNVKVCPLEPAQSAFMSTGISGEKHRIQGIGDGFIPEIVHLDELDDILVVDDFDAILMARLLAQKLGLGVGISSGANFIGAVMAQNIYGKDANTITIFSDDTKKYLSSDTNLFEEPKEDFISNDIELISVDAECICDKRIFEGVCDHFEESIELENN